MKLKAQNIVSEVQSGRRVEADVEDDHDILEDGESTVYAWLAVGNMPPVAEHTDNNGHQVEDQQDSFQHQYFRQLLTVIFQAAVTWKNCVKYIY